MAASLVGLGMALGMALGTNPAAHAQHAHELTASLGLDLVTQLACPGHVFFSLTLRSTAAA